MRESLARGGARISEERGLRQKGEGNLVAARMTSIRRWSKNHNWRKTRCRIS